MKPNEESKETTKQPTRESVNKPGKDDVHEQREEQQPHEGTVSGAPVQNPPPRH